MVVIADQLVTRRRSIRRAAQSRSQRDITTSVAPLHRGPFIPACMPVTWNIGSGLSTTAPSPLPRHCR